MQAVSALVTALLVAQVIASGSQARDHRCRELREFLVAAVFEADEDEALRRSQLLAAGCPEETLVACQELVDVWKRGPSEVGALARASVVVLGKSDPGLKRRVLERVVLNGATRAVWALPTLGLVGGADAEAAGFLASHLWSAPEKISGDAAQALGDLGQEAIAFRPALLEVLLHSSSDSTKRAAGTSLIRIDPEYFSRYASKLIDDNELLSDLNAYKILRELHAPRVGRSGSGEPTSD